MGFTTYNFKGDVVVITGAASGIGKGTALAFAKAGADLALCDFNEVQGEEVAKMCRDLGSNAKFYKVDVTNTKMVESVRDEILKDFGKITCLFSNAGVSQDVMGPPLESVPDETWERTLNINLMGCIKVCRAFSQPMKAANYGKIVMTASIAVYSLSPIMAAYNVSKIGVLGFMETLCAELGDYNINVNAVNPGYVYTPMYEDGGAMRIREKSKVLGKFEDPKSVVTAMASTSALHRMQTVDDLANGVMFLCSDTSKEITGQVLNVDSGAARRI